MHDVLASLKEAIESNKQSVCGDFPLVLGLGLVVKVGIFEFVANINSERKFLVSFTCFSRINKSENLLSTDLVLALVNNCIANFSNQNHKS
jgi:hypothetical protein